MKNTLIIFCFLILNISSILAQDRTKSFGYDPSTIFIKPTTINSNQYSTINARQPLWLPFVETIGINLGVSSFNRYVLEEPFAVINAQTIKDNFKTGFTWDADQFITNQVGHPYQGSLYYNFARSAGYDYWTSLGVTTFGSLQWEFFMENEPASVNDFISTSLSGAALGEILYRTSSFVLDESTTGWERFFRESGAFLISPTRGLNRLFDGRMRRYTPKCDSICREVDIAGNVALGMNNVADGTNIKLGTSNLMGTVEFTYGTPFEGGKVKPFDLFKFDMGLNASEQPFVGYLTMYGLLAGKRIVTLDEQNLLAGIFQHYDYFDNSVYQIGATSIGPGMMYHFPQVSEADVITSFHLAAILMGAANSEYALDWDVVEMDSARAYNFGMGINAKFEVIIQIEKLQFYYGYYIYWIRTLQGAPGDELVGMLKPKVRFFISNNLSVNFEYLIYHRHAVYDNYDNINLKNTEQRLSISYRF